jgi:hypothetical protein
MHWGDVYNNDMLFYRKCQRLAFACKNLIATLFISVSALDTIRHTCGTSQYTIKIMPWCTAYYCNTNSAKGKNPNRYSFHRYPLKDKDLLLKWLCFAKRDDFTPTKHSTICSKHFEDSCFVEDLYGKYVGRSPGKSTTRRLKPGSVPTKCNEPSTGVQTPAPKARESSINRQKKRDHDEVKLNSFNICTLVNVGKG